jgi:PPOX class probable F420-dependent enzyme
MSMELSSSLLDLLRKPSLCFLATTMPNGSPQLTETWVDTDGEHIVINTVEGFQKVRNIGRDPRVAVAIADAEQPTRYVQVRGRVIDVTTEGGAEHIEKLSQKYTGKPYPWYGGRDQVRTILTIEADHIHGMGH